MNNVRKLLDARPWLGLLLIGMACQQSGTQAPAVNHAGSMRGASGAALIPLVHASVEAFQTQFPETKVTIDEARSAVAIKKLIDGELDLAFTSRPVRSADVAAADQKGKRLHMVVIAAEAVAVVVHPDCPVRDISIDQLKAIFFTGEIRDWAALTGGQKHGPIKVVAVNPKTSGTGDLFVSTIAGDDKAKYIPEAEMVAYSDDTIAKFAADPDAISFSGMGNVKASVRAVTINTIVPSEKTILDTSYVLNRKLFVITDGPPKHVARDFVKFLLSDRGQRIARAKGITPIVLD
jgi:phosphate transport system substrate-binding protein